MRLEKRGHGGVFATDTGRMLGTVCQEMIKESGMFAVQPLKRRNLPAVAIKGKDISLSTDIQIRICWCFID